MPPLRVLVLCTGNSCRSQMAEGFFRKFGGNRIDVHSAGLIPQGLHPKAVAVMREVGVDISAQTSKHLGVFLDREFDYVITACDKAARHCPSFPGPARRLHWPFEDPTAAAGDDEEILDAFRRVLYQIGQRVLEWFL